MLIVTVCALSLLFLYLIYKFAKFAVALYFILCAAFIASFPLMLYNLDWGVTLLAWSAALVICSYLLVVFSAFVGGMITLFIVTPIATVWYAVKLMFVKLK